MNIKYHRINENELKDLPFSEGSMYFCKDSGKLYADPIGGGGTHILINDNINDISISTNSTWSSNKINESITNTKTELNQSIESSVNSAKTELSSDYNNKIKLAAPVNLLDNSDFTNPVNQRGQNSYTGDFIHTIDRWKLGNNGESVEVLDKSIKLTSNNYGFIYQSLPKLCKGSYTFVCKFTNNTGTIALTNYWTDNGLATSQSSSDPSGKIYLNFTLDEDVTDPGYTFLRISLTTVGSVELLNTALYKGEYTTDILPEYKSKGYGVELSECQRYYQQYEGIYCDVINSTDIHIVHVPFSYATPFRIKPTVNITTFAWNDSGWVEEPNIATDSTTTACRIYFGPSAYTAIHMFNLYVSADL